MIGIGVVLGHRRVSIFVDPCARAGQLFEVRLLIRSHWVPPHSSSA